MFVISNNNNAEAPFRVESDLTIQEASHIQDFTLWKKTETNKLQLSQMYRQLSDSTSGWNEHLGVTQLLWLTESFSMLRAVANLENSVSGASVSLENKKNVAIVQKMSAGGLTCISGCRDPSYSRTFAKSDSGPSQAAIT